MCHLSNIDKGGATFQGRKLTKHHEDRKEPTEKERLFYLNGVYYRTHIPRTGNGYRSSVLAVQAVSRSRRHIRTREHGKRENARAHVLNANALDEFRRSQIRNNKTFLSRKETKGLELRHLARYACTIIYTGFAIAKRPSNKDQQEKQAQVRRIKRKKVKKRALF